jgi:RNA polymerase sigma factor (sigma-70 family)
MTDETNLTNETVIAAVNGERSALDKLATIAGRRLLAFFIKHGVELSDAEDLSQDTLVRAFSKLAAGQFTLHTEAPAAAMVSWVLNFGRFVLLEHQRKASRVSSLHDELSYRSTHPELEPIPGSANNPLAQAIKKAMRALPPDDALIIRASHIHELKDAEIAQAWDLPGDTVRKRLSRARARFRALLEQDARVRPHQKSGGREQPKETQLPECAAT